MRSSLLFQNCREHFLRYRPTHIQRAWLGAVASLKILVATGLVWAGSGTARATNHVLLYFFAEQWELVLVVIYCTQRTIFRLLLGQLPFRSYMLIDDDIIIVVYFWELSFGPITRKSSQFGQYFFFDDLPTAVIDGTLRLVNSQILRRLGKRVQFIDWFLRAVFWTWGIILIRFFIIVLLFFAILRILW